MVLGLWLERMQQSYLNIAYYSLGFSRDAVTPLGGYSLYSGYCC